MTTLGGSTLGGSTLGGSTFGGSIFGGVAGWCFPPTPTATVDGVVALALGAELGVDATDATLEADGALPTVAAVGSCVAVSEGTGETLLALAAAAAAAAVRWLR